MELLITRYFTDQDLTCGQMLLHKNGKDIFSCFCLELPWANNTRFISCIPAGVYSLEPRFTEHRGKHLSVCGVKNRDLILIHAGNYAKDTKGCILPGDTFRDIDDDGHLDVTNSRKTLNRLLKHIGNQATTLRITWVTKTLL